MANDNEIDVKIKATTDQLAPGMNSAASTVEQSTAKMRDAVTGATARIRDSMTQAAEAVKSSSGGIAGSVGQIGAAFSRMNVVVAGALALLAGSKFFGAAVESTKDFGDEAERLARAVGFTATEASQLNVAIGDIYASSDDYIDANQRLTRQLKANEEGLRNIGIQTRDQNGNLRNAKDLMLDAIAAVNGYKEGTDRNIAAQVAFGRDMSGTSALLKLNNDVLDEAKRKQAELGLVVGAQNVADLKAYKAAMNDAGDVVMAVKKAIGDALMPVLTSLANWFSVVGPAAVTVIKGAIGGVVSIFYGLKMAAEIVYEALALGITILSEKFISFGKVISSSLRGDWQGATAAIQQAGANVSAALDDAMASIMAKAQSNRDALWNLFAKPDAATTSGAGKTASDNLLSGNDGGRTKEFDNELAQRKLAFAREQEAAGTFYQFSLSAERDFWASKLRIQDLSKEDRLSVEKKYLDASLQIRKQEFEAHIAGLKTQIDASKNHWDDQIALARKAAADIGQAYGLSSKEYEAAARDVIKLEQQKATALLQINQDNLREMQAQQLDAITMDQQVAQQQLDQGIITKKEMLQREIDFENQRFEVTKAGYDARIELLRDEPVELAKARNLALDAERKHQLDLQKLNNKLAVEKGNPLQNIFGSMESGFSHALDSMLQNTKTFRGAISGLFMSIAESFQTEMIAKPIAAWIAKHATMIAVKLGFMAEAQTADVTGAATLAATNVAEVMSNAAVAASGAYAAIAMIPFVGPALAPAAAATAYAGTAMYAPLASASGGYDIPAGVNPMTQLHAEEMVLPAKYANAIRGMASQSQAAAGGAGGGDVHFHAHGVQDARSVDIFFGRNGRQLAKSLRNQARNFNTGTRVRT